MHAPEPQPRPADARRRFARRAIHVAVAAAALVGAVQLVPERAQAQEIGQPITRPCNHPCASQILFRRDPSYDRLSLHARIIPMSDIDPVNEGITVEISNSIDLIAAFSLGPGDLRAAPGGKKFTYRDARAIRDGGIAQLVISQRNDGPGGYRVDVAAYNDLSLATEAEMTIRIVVGDDVFTNTSLWTEKRLGWIVHLPS
jgi:hypothetical protein